ncbi:MAG: response regulator [Ruminococcus sp.]|nr:response regulator [Ruminococcus sp.]
MYHCHIGFYLAGERQDLFEIIKQMPALENFTHDFSDNISAENADVIITDASGDKLKSLIRGKKASAELILLAGKDKISLPDGELSEISDIWTLPLSGTELRFRFLKWQREQKKDKDLWETRQFLDATINNIPNLVWYKDKNGVHEKVNASFCKTVNKTMEQIEGQTHAYIWGVATDDPSCIESEAEVMNTKKTFVSEEKVRSSEGEKLLATYKSPLYDIDGSIMGTVGVAIDITQERTYQEYITQRNNNLEAIFTNMDCGILCHTVDGSKILNVNHAALSILGYSSEEELTAEGFNMVAASVLEEDKGKLRNAMSKLHEPGDSISVEYRVEHKNGEIRHVMGNIKLLDENGILSYQRFLLDCTAQKLTENMKRMEHERRQTELIHALSIDYNLVCFFDLDTGNGYSLRINDCGEGVLDSIFTGKPTLEDGIKRYVNNCVYDEDRERMLNTCSAENLKKLLSDKSSTYITYRTLCGGETKYFQMKVVRAGSWDESKTIVLGFKSVDRQMKDEIEKKRLLEDALLQANRANQAKSVFLSNMSHDIRTPMNAIVGFTSLAINQIDNKEKVGDYLKKILASEQHLLSLINDVLDMSRIESGKVHLENAPCRISDILDGLAGIVHVDIVSKHIDLIIDSSDISAESMICCDKLRLNQVLLNLLSNAVKYTNPGGSIAIKVTSRPAANEGFEVYEFSIQDTGIGMSSEFVSRIFEPFERERNSTISGIQGTGLGMAITKKIVDMMHGAIDVQSKQGEGTLVTVRFTFAIYSEEDAERESREFEGHSALIVNNHSSSCIKLSYILEQLGMHTEQALSGEDAVRSASDAMEAGRPYDVFIIDSDLHTGIDAIETVRLIKDMFSEKNAIILMTAYDCSGIEERALDAGVSAFCSKPPLLEEIRNSLITVREKQSSASAERKSYSGRILLAEDNMLNQEIAEAILNEAGFTVEIAENGKIAVDMLKRSAPGYYKLILMDLQMPIMNGLEASMAIRALSDKQLAEIPIFAMTANAFEEDKQAALKCGMNGHIAKPIDVNILFDTLDKVM